jgi:hypothetical protein
VKDGWNDFYDLGNDNYNAELEFYGLLTEQQLSQAASERADLAPDASSL